MKKPPLVSSLSTYDDPGTENSSIEALRTGATPVASRASTGEGSAHAALYGRAPPGRSGQRSRRGEGPRGRPRDPGRPRRRLQELLGRRGQGPDLLPGR